MFLSNEFSFNGIDSNTKDIHLVTLDSDVLTTKGVAFQRNISPVEGFSQLNPMFKDEETEPDDIVLNFMYIKNDIPQVWTEDKLIDIKKWFITDEFAPFISKDNSDYIYYFKCKKIEEKMTSGNKGVLEVTFKPFSHFVYKRYNSRIHLESKTTMEIENPSLYEYKPIIILTNKGSNSTVNKICDLEIKGLDKDEVVEIDNLMLTALSPNGENKFSKCNRNWITLSPGINNLTLSGNCDIEIICEFPILL